MDINSPKKKGPAQWARHLLRSITQKSIVARVGDLALDLVCAEVIRVLLERMLE